MHSASGLAYALLTVGFVLNLALLGRSPESDDALSRRDRLAVKWRRHPLLQGVALACQLAAVALLTAGFVT